MMGQRVADTATQSFPTGHERADSPWSGAGRLGPPSWTFLEVHQVLTPGLLPPGNARGASNPNIHTHIKHSDARRLVFFTPTPLHTQNTSRAGRCRCTSLLSAQPGCTAREHRSSGSLLFLHDAYLQGNPAWKLTTHK